MQIQNYLYTWGQFDQFRLEITKNTYAFFEKFLIKVYLFWILFDIKFIKKIDSFKLYNFKKRISKIHNSV